MQNFITLLVMKKVIFVLFLMVLSIFKPHFCMAQGGFFEKEITLNGRFDECLKDINIEEEIKNYMQQDPIYINLRECIEIALLYNYIIKAQSFGYDISKWDYKKALSNFLFNVGSSSYTIYYSGQVLVGAALVDKFNELALSFNIHAEHKLTRGGEDIFEALRSKNVKFAQRHRLNFTYSEVLLNTTIQYWELLRRKLDIEIYQKNYKERCAQLKQTENLKDAGLGTKFDVIRAQSELAQAKQNLLDALQEFRFSQAKLSNILGIEITTPLMPIENEAREYKLNDENKDIETLFYDAKYKREDIKALEKEIVALKNEKRKIYTQFAPKARVFAQEQWQGTADTGVGPASIVAGYLDINLGENMGFGTIAQARAKQAQIDKSIVELEQKLRDIKENILNSYYESKISKEQVDYATQSAELAELRLDAGEGILIDVIQAQTFKTRTKIELLSSIINYNISQVQMLFDSGNIGVKEILKDYAP